MRPDLVIRSAPNVCWFAEPLLGHRNSRKAGIGQSVDIRRSDSISDVSSIARDLTLKVLMSIDV